MKNRWLDWKSQQRKATLRKNQMKILELKNTADFTQWNKEYLKTSASLVAQGWRIHLPMQQTWVQLLGWEDPLEKEMVTNSSNLAGKIPWTEEPSGPQCTGSQTVGHDWSDWARSETNTLSSFYHLYLSLLWSLKPDSLTCSVLIPLLPQIPTMWFREKKQKPGHSC